MISFVNRLIMSLKLCSAITVIEIGQHLSEQEKPF